MTAIPELNAFCQVSANSSGTTLMTRTIISGHQPCTEFKQARGRGLEISDPPFYVTGVDPARWGVMEHRHPPDLRHSLVHVVHIHGP
jgi:hypothetical protein